MYNCIYYRIIDMETLSKNFFTNQNPDGRLLEGLEENYTASAFVSISNCSMSFGENNYTFDNYNSTFDNYNFTFDNYKSTFDNYKFAFDNCKFSNCISFIIIGFGNIVRIFRKHKGIHYNCNLLCVDFLSFVCDYFYKITQITEQITILPSRSPPYFA